MHDHSIYLQLTGHELVERICLEIGRLPSGPNLSLEPRGQSESPVDLEFQRSLMQNLFR